MIDKVRISKPVLLMLKLQKTVTVDLFIYSLCWWRFSCFYFHNCLCLFDVKADDLLKTDRDWSISSHFFLFSVVSMVKERPVFPENGHFHLNLCRYPYFRLFRGVYLWNHHCLMSKMVSHFFEIVLWSFFIALKLH